MEKLKPKTLNEVDGKGLKLDFNDVSAYCAAVWKKIEWQKRLRQQNTISFPFDFTMVFLGMHL